MNVNDFKACIRRLEMRLNKCEAEKATSGSESPGTSDCPQCPDSPGAGMMEIFSESSSLWGVVFADTSPYPAVAFENQTSHYIANDGSYYFNAAYDVVGGMTMTQYDVDNNVIDTQYCMPLEFDLNIVSGCRKIVVDLVTVAIENQSSEEVWVVTIDYPPGLAHRIGAPETWFNTPKVTGNFGLIATSNKDVYFYKNFVQVWFATIPNSGTPASPSDPGWDHVVIVDVGGTPTPPTP